MPVSRIAIVRVEVRRRSVSAADTALKLILDNYFEDLDRDPIIHIPTDEIGEAA